MLQPLTTALLIFVGTSSNTKDANRGIYAVRLDPATGAFTEAALAAETPNPGFLALHPNGRFVYACGEAGLLTPKMTAGAVNAYAYDAATGRLTLLNQQPTGGSPVTHLVVDSTGHALMSASYHGGQVAAFPLDADGRIGPRTAWVLTAGKPGPNTARQDRPHPHSVTLSPDNRHLYVCDLGLDRIFCYRLEAEHATLTPAGEFPTTPGAGPRHSKFSADGKFFYAIHELGSAITVYACDPATGALTPIQIVPTLPDGFTGENTCAEIRLYPSGRFVYGSNRGHDSIAVFARDSARGTLTRIEIVPCGGRHPRNFALSPDGAWLVCANRDSNNLVSFRIDPATGRLTRASEVKGIPSPTCVLFAPGKT
jgi:6-phosphogluconolactonase